MIFFWIIISIVLFSIIVLIHEYGHYKAAKIFGIHVEEFGLGIPPRAKKLWKNKNGTLFSLNWIPLWGFVKISWESGIFLNYYDEKGKKLDKKGLLDHCKNSKNIFHSNKAKISLSERKYLKAYLKHEKKGENFHEKSIFQKSIVLLAWVMMNFVLAGIIFSVLFFIWVKPVWVNSVIPTDTSSKIIPTFEQALEEKIILKNPWIVLFPLGWSIAQTAGIQNGDILISLNGFKYSDISALQKYISERKNWEVHLYVTRKVCEENWVCRDVYDDIYLTTSPEWKIWSYLSPNYVINKDFIYKYSLFESIKYGSLETYYQARLTLSWLALLGKNIISPDAPEDRQEALDQVAWPIGIVSIITQSLAGWMVIIILLWAIISVNLWVFNLLPIPALDGWRLLLLWIRTSIDKVLWKKALSIQVENMAHILFFALLILLSIFIAYNDIIKIFN